MCFFINFNLRNPLLFQFFFFLISYQLLHKVEVEIPMSPNHNLINKFKASLECSMKIFFFNCKKHLFFHHLLGVYLVDRKHDKLHDARIGSSLGKYKNKLESRMWMLILSSLFSPSNLSLH